MNGSCTVMHINPGFNMPHFKNKTKSMTKASTKKRALENYSNTLYLFSGNDTLKFDRYIQGQTFIQDKHHLVCMKQSLSQN